MMDTTDGQEKIARHPAKFSDEFLPLFAQLLCGKKRVLDPFAGTGKIAEIKRYGWGGQIYANDIESDWIRLAIGKCDVITCKDAERLPDIYPAEFFDAFCTSPTYGNRMADHHNAKDGSKRNTYTHCIGHELAEGNTGKMQWGDEYKQKHVEIYRSLRTILKTNGLFVLNVSDHIRKGERVRVSAWHLQTLTDLGFECIKDIKVPTRRNRFGANADARVECEHIYVLKKKDREVMSDGRPD